MKQDIMNSVVKAPLHAGKYPVQIISAEVVENQQGGYLKIVFSFPDREVAQCYFDTNIGYLKSTLRNQLGLSKDATFGELLELAKASNSLFAVVSYDEQYGLNIALHEASPKSNVTF